MKHESLNPLSLSIVIAAHRAGAMLDGCFSAVAQLEPKPREVIVAIDGGCTQVIAAAEARGFKVIPLPQAPGVSATRNAGARAATGSVLAFLDSDVTPQSDFVSRALEVLAAPPGAAAAFGSYDDAPAARGIVSRYRNLLHHHTHQHANREAQTFWAACGVCRAAVFWDVGGFDENYRMPSIEDIDLGYRLRRAGHRIVLEPSLQICHLKHWSLQNLIVTDFSCRALPWTLLLLREGRLDNDLNIDAQSRLSAALSLLAVGGMLLAIIKPAALLLSILSAFAVIFMNRRFYCFLERCGGVGFAIAAIPLHFAYFLTALAGYAAGTVVFRCKALSAMFAAER